MSQHSGKLYVAVVIESSSLSSYVLVDTLSFESSSRRLPDSTLIKTSEEAVMPSINCVLGYMLNIKKLLIFKKSSNATVFWTRRTLLMCHTSWFQPPNLFLAQLLLLATLSAPSPMRRLHWSMTRFLPNLPFRQKK